MCIELIGWDAEASAAEVSSRLTARRLHDAAAPTATASLCVVLAVLPAEPPVVRHQPVKPVAADDGAHPKERKVTAQSRRGGGTSFPQLGHGEHEKMSGDVVVLQCRVGSHGACMGSARAQREARGAIFKDVLESVARKVARNGTDFRGARSDFLGTIIEIRGTLCDEDTCKYQPATRIK